MVLASFLTEVYKAKRSQSKAISDLMDCSRQEVEDVMAIIKATVHKPTLAIAE